MKRPAAALSLLALAGLIAGMAGRLAVRPAGTPAGEGVAPRSVTFHVVAHSDRPEDQALKLKVRDAVAGDLVALTAAARTPAQTEALIVRERGRIERLAAAALRRSGSGDPVRLEVRTQGDRRQVRLVIGAGAGHNWFCVLYPPLCVLVREGRAPDEVPVEVRSAFLDWLRSARQGFAGRTLVGFRSR